MSEEPTLEQHMRDARHSLARLIFGHYIDGTFLTYLPQQDGETWEHLGRYRASNYHGVSIGQLIDEGSREERDKYVPSEYVSDVFVKLFTDLKEMNIMEFLARFYEGIREGRFKLAEKWDQTPALIENTKFLLLERQMPLIDFLTATATYILNRAERGSIIEISKCGSEQTIAYCPEKAQQLEQRV